MVQKSLKTPLRNIKMAPYSDFHIVSKINQGGCLGCLGGNDAPELEQLELEVGKCIFVYF